MEEPIDNKIESADRAVSGFFDYLALACVFGAVDSMISAKSWKVWGAALAIALLLYAIGITWPRMRRKAGPGLAALFDGIASNAGFRDVAILAIVGYFVATGHYTQYRTALVALAAGYVLVIGLGHLRSVRKDLDMYVMPRVLTNRQVKKLRAYLSGREPYAVTVKVNPRDAEAREYAARIFNALRETKWNAQFSTSDGDPFCNNDGLSIHVGGLNARPQEQKNDPSVVLRSAFQAARIEVNGGSTVSAGEYKLFILVGHRPLVVGYRGSILSRLGRFLQRFG